MRGLARLSAVFAAAALLPAAGPVNARAKLDYAMLCQFEIKPKGYYTYPAGQQVPVVTPGKGGTRAEAELLNACIRGKAAADGATQKSAKSGFSKSKVARPDVPVPEDAQGPSYTKKQRGAAVLTGGSGYRGSYLEGGNGRGAVRAAPASQPIRASKRVPKGATPLPSGYPLLPGDEDLWYSLTPAQQQRAIEFLNDGSTIRSSLQAD